MTERSYHLHRALKMTPSTRRVLQLIDRDLADAGVTVPPTSSPNTDEQARTLVSLVMSSVLRAA